MTYRLVRKKINAKFFFVFSFITLIPLLVNFVWILILKNYRSEFPNLAVKLSGIEITFNFFVLITGYFSFFFLYLFCDTRRVILSRSMLFYFNRLRLEKFLLFLISLNIFFYLSTGIGKAGSWERHPFSFLVYLFNLDLLFIIFYITYREEINKKFIIITILYYIFQLLKGWTGFILSFFLMEMFYRSFQKKYFRFLLILPCVFFIGALFYQFLYPLKFFIRLGVFEQITYSDALIRLMERFTFFSHSVVGIQNSDIIARLYKNYGYNHTEIYGFFRATIPSFIFKNKDFRSLGNLIMQSVYPSITDRTASNMGFFSYFYNLINISLADFLLYISYFTVLTFIYKIIIDLVVFQPKKNDVIKQYSSFLFFQYIMAAFSAGALENLRYGWFSIIWTYAFFMLCRIIKIRRIN